MPTSPDTALERHLTAWLGCWPPRDGEIAVVSSARRDEPGWDGAIRPLIGVLTKTGGVISVTPRRIDAVREAVAGHSVAGLEDVRPSVEAALGSPRGRLRVGVFRWTVDPVPMPDAGMWVPVSDPVVPPWLKPFGGEVLVAVGDGVYLAGVGLKRHDPSGEEIAVVTEPHARGRGLARRLVSQAARSVVERGAVVTYLHAPENAASARVAQACGFADRGWLALSVRA